LGLSV